MHEILQEHAVTIASDKKFFLIGSFVVTGCHAEEASSRELTENGLKTRVVSIVNVFFSLGGRGE